MDLEKVVARIGLVAGPLLGALAFWLAPESMSPMAARVAAIAVWMSVYWITAALPLAATALIPLVAFPLWGVASGGKVATSFTNDIVFLFIGGFLVAIAMEQCDLHKRLALNILKLCGVHPVALLFGFLIATAFISMWVSNTATTMMMIPIAIALLSKLDEVAGSEAVRPFGIAVLLGVAYASSIGGVATLVGTAPNLVLVQTFEKLFPEAPKITFIGWMIYATPLAAMLLLAAGVWLAIRYRIWRLRIDGVDGVFRQQLKDLGPMNRDQDVVALVFTVLALLWITRSGFELEGLSIPGWDRLFPDRKAITDGTVAILCALLLFFIPSRTGGFLLESRSISKVPWDIVLLFGGGFALADSFRDSGLSQWLGTQFESLKGVSPIVMMIVVCFGITFLTEVTSNTATAQILMPVLAANAVAMEMDPRLLMITGGISCSMAFMLPVATPPNAIAFASGRIRIGDMVQSGLMLNMIGIVLIPLMLWLLGDVAFGLDWQMLPDWAKPTP